MMSYDLNIRAEFEKACKRMIQLLMGNLVPGTNEILELELLSERIATHRRRDDFQTSDLAWVVNG